MPSSAPGRRPGKRRRRRPPAPAGITPGPRAYLAERLGAARALAFIQQLAFSSSVSFSQWVGRPPAGVRAARVDRPGPVKARGLKYGLPSTRVRPRVPATARIAVARPDLDLPAFGQFVQVFADGAALMRTRSR